MKYLSLLILSILLCYSCDSAELRSMSAEELETLMLQQGFIEENVPKSAVSQLAPEEAFFLAVKAASFGYEKTALLLSRHSWQNSSGIIREKAASLHVQTAFEMNLWADAEFTASLAASEYPGHYEFRRAAVASAYWLRKDSELTARIEALQKLSGGAEDHELYLFKSVSAYRIKSPGWEDFWIDMFLNIPSSEFIKRGWDYFSAAEDDPYIFFKGYEQLIDGKYLISSGEYPDGIELLSQWLKQWIGDGASLESSKTTLNDLEKLYTRQGANSKGAAFFEELATEAADPALSAACNFAAARLYRKAGWYTNAARVLDALIEAFGEEASDRLLWYSLDIAVKQNPVAAAAALEFYTELWDDPGYFADALDDLCTGLVRRRKWKEIAGISKLISDSGPPEIGDRYHFITVRAASEGLLTDNEVAGQQSARSYTDLYYRILTGDPLAEFSACWPASAALPSDAELGPTERYINGLLKWNLYDRVLDEIRAYRAELSEPFLVYCAGAAVGRQEYLDSIRMMYQYQGKLSCNGLMSLYPDVYREEIEFAAGENGIPVQLLFALVWKESGFEREIVSRSGAVGLSQLMPSTAEDVAGRLKMRLPDLTDPKENLLTGSWYLNWLIGYVGNNSAAVISYNGGPGRVKRWMREYSDLSPDLLYEAVPVAETHQYGKKVLTASVLYGMFYYNIEPAETLGIFFPE